MTQVIKIIKLLTPANGRKQGEQAREFRGQKAHVLGPRCHSLWVIKAMLSRRL